MTRSPLRSRLRPTQRVLPEIERTPDALDRVIDTSVASGRPVPMEDRELMRERYRAGYPEDQGQDDDEPPYDDAIAGIAEAVNNRVDAVGANPYIRKEYRLRLVHRMTVRQMPLDMMARALGCSTRQVIRLREDMRAQLRKEASERDLPTYIGLTDAFYNDIIGMSMQMATKDRSADLVRLRAMEKAMQAQRDRVNLYKESGFFSALRLTPVGGVGDERAEQANQLIEMSKNLFGVFGMSEDEYDARYGKKGKKGDIGAHEVFKRGDQDEDDDDIRIRIL